MLWPALSVLGSALGDGVISVVDDIRRLRKIEESFLSLLSESLEPRLSRLSSFPFKRVESNADERVELLRLPLGL